MPLNVLAYYSVVIRCLMYSYIDIKARGLAPHCNIFDCNQVMDQAMIEAYVDTVQGMWLADTTCNHELWRRFAPSMKNRPAMKNFLSEPSWESATILGMSTLPNHDILSCETASAHSDLERHVGALRVQVWEGLFPQHMQTTKMYPGEVLFLNQPFLNQPFLNHLQVLLAQVDPFLSNWGFEFSETIPSATAQLYQKA